MTDNHSNGRQVRRIPAFADTLVELPRSAKRVIMLVADALVMPIALWAALVAKTDSFSPPLHYSYLLVASAGALLIFSALGLYRAVIRFMGPRAMLNVVSGVTLSVLALALYDRLDLRIGPPAEGFPMITPEQSQARTKRLQKLRARRYKLENMIADQRQGDSCR